MSTSKKGPQASVMSHDPLANFDELDAKDVPVDVAGGAVADSVPEIGTGTEQQVASVDSDAQEVDCDENEASLNEAHETTDDDLTVAAPNQEDDEMGGINLGDSLTIQEVSNLHDTVKSALSTGGTLTFHGGSVERIDGAGIQLLCAIFKEANSQHMKISWGSASEVLVNAVKLVGVAQAIELAGESE